MSQVDSSSQTVQPRNRKLRRALIPIILVVVAAIAYAAYTMIRMNTLSPTPDLSTTRTSEQALFRGTWVSQLDPIEINQMHTWTVHVETPDGQPLDNAQIAVDGGMPQHGHGLPTQPKVTQYLGKGDYRVEGMKFQMTGWWVVNFHISVDGKTDTLQFNLILK